MANRFLVAGGDGLWNSTSNWAATTGAASGASFPVAGDVVAFDSNSGNAGMTVNVASACASLVMSGTYAGTLTFNAQLTVTSTNTFVSACTLAGTTGPLVWSSGGTMTSGGKTLPCPLNFGAGSATNVTLADDWTVTGLFTVTTGGGNGTVNGVGRTMTCNGGLHLVSGSLVGSSRFVLGGGTWDSSGVSVGLSLDLAGNVTVSGAVATTGTMTLRYVSGTVTTTGSTLTAASGGTTLDTAGVTWNNLALSGTSQTYTLSSNLAWSGALTAGSNTAVTFAGAGTLAGPGNFSSTLATVTLNNTGGLNTTGTLTLPNAAQTWAGSAGFTVGTLTTATLTTSRTHTLTFGNTYVVTTALTNVGTTAAIRQVLLSSSAGNKVVFTLTPGANCNLLYCDPTDVDSSAGATVLSVNGTITTSLNWLGSYVTPTGSGTGGASILTSSIIHGLGVL